MLSNKYHSNPHSFDGIHFKSQAEVMVYKTLKECGLNPSYESTKFILWEGFSPTVPFYDRDKSTGQLRLQTTKIKDITYTPDFTFNYGNTTCIIEVKGMENDVFPLKKKLFRKHLEEIQSVRKCIYFEIRTKRELLQAIDIVKNEENK